jgi:hypothetical protein
MTRKVWMLIALAIALGGLSLYLNRDWFAKNRIQITYRSRPARAMFFRRGRAPRYTAVDPIVFGFNRKLRLNWLKVVPVSQLETNKYAQPIWHLVSESNSVPIRTFIYGAPIRGMHPAVRGATPNPLEPGVKYRLLVEAGKYQGQEDFTPLPRTP